jgi:hypothetical protein
VDRVDLQRGSIDLNRVGCVHLSRFDGDGGTSDPDFWARLAAAPDPKPVVDELCGAAGLPATGALPELEADATVYRFIAAFLAHGAFGRPGWECRNGYDDTSGYGGGTRTGWFEPFDGGVAALEESRDDDLLGIAAYRFWFLVRYGEPKLCLETGGRVWDRRGSRHQLPVLYRGRIWPVVDQVAGHLLP